MKIIITLVFFFSLISCTASVQTINSAEDLKAYLDKQPANTSDNPIRVTMNANAPMLPNIAATINSSGKYVSLSFSGSTLTIIPDNAFYDESTKQGCALLTEITIPDSVTSIGNQAFYNCTSLTNVTIPDSVTSIYNQAFYNCTSLANVNIPNSVSSIYSETFYSCASLTSVTIPKSVTSIYSEAFRYSGLTSVIIPDSVTSIGWGAFYGCIRLTSVRFEGIIASNNFAYNAFADVGNLYNAYLAGGIGMYTRPDLLSETWTKQ
jgi:hypothetical protein